MSNRKRRRCVAIYRTEGLKTDRVAEFVNEDGGPVELRVLTTDFANEVHQVFERGFGSRPLGRRVTALDGDAFLDGALEDLASGTYWRAVEESDD